MYRYVYHMGIDSITSVTCALVVVLPENSVANQLFLPVASRSSSGVVVKLLVSGARGPGSIPSLAATISEIGYLLLLSREMAERSLRRRKS